MPLFLLWEGEIYIHMQLYIQKSLRIHKEFNNSSYLLAKNGRNCMNMEKE